MPFKHHAEHRHHIPKPQYRVTNWADYDASLKRRGSLTVWFTDEAVAAWRAEPRTTPGGQPHYSALAITTALTMGMVFHLALRQTEGLIGSVIGLLGLDLAVPDHSTLSRRGKTLEVPPPRRASSGPLHLLVDSTGLKLGGTGEWLIEKNGASRRRSWRKLHIGVDADSGEIVAVAVTRKDIDDAATVDTLLGQIAVPITSFTADGAYDQDRVSQAVAEHDPDAAIIAPPRAGAVANASAETAPIQRDRHLRMIAEHGRMAWQKASGYNLRAKVEASIGRYKRVIGDAIRSRADDRGRPRRSCPEPNAGAWTPELCPYLLNNRLGWGIASAHLRTPHPCNTVVPALQRPAPASAAISSQKVVAELFIVGHCSGGISPARSRLGHGRSPRIPPLPHDRPLPASAVWPLSC
ncbi:MAG: hypothetical protein QOF70_6021 [Acetobacteraceae bacterium]|nr:hypothetical protein [Acetobacteraceae bacterium]